MSKQIIGLDSLKKKLNMLATKIDVMPAIKKGTRIVQRAAKEYVPVDTGALRASIFTLLEPEKLQGLVYTDLEYGPYVEFGTVYSQAIPFLIPAYEENIKAIQRDIKKSVREQMRRIANM